MNNVLSLTPNRDDTRKSILKQLGRNDKDFEDDIKTLQTWLKSQKHLPQITTRNMLEWYLINCKFSIEKCKQKLDMYYTLKTVMPEIFKNKHPKSPHLRKQFEVAVTIPMLTLTENNERVVFTAFFDPSEDRFWEIYFAHSFSTLDIRVREDLCVSTVFVCDLKNTNFNLMLKLNPVVLKKVYKSFENGYAGRIAGFHFVNCPSIIDNVVSLLKSVVSDKLGKRIYVHSNIEGLQKHISKELIPEEYGGTGPSFPKLIDLWKRKFEASYKIFDQLEEIEVDESLRPAPLNNDAILGFHGNFKKLNLD